MRKREVVEWLPCQVDKRGIKPVCRRGVSILAAETSHAGLAGPSSYKSVERRIYQARQRRMRTVLDLSRVNTASRA